MQVVIDNMPFSMWIKDKDGKFIIINKSFENQYGYSKEEVINKYNSDIFPKKKADKYTANENLVIKENKNIIFRQTEGEKILEALIKPLRGDNDELIGTVGVLQDVTKREKIEENLRELSYRDSLTGLYNRNYFEKAIKELDDTDSLPLSIIMGDINGLKIVNDSLGHLEGDKFIMKITEVIRCCVGKDKDIVRWGGDEIIVLLPNTTEIQAEELTEKIFSTCKSTTYSPIPLSISLGISTRTDKNKLVDTMFKEAENKLYRQKLIQDKSIRGAIMDSLKKNLEKKARETHQHITRIYDHAMWLGKKNEI